MKLNLLQWLIQGIPECIAVVFLGLAIHEKRLDIKKALIPGLLQAMVLYIIRLFPLPFGIHTMLAIVSLSVLLCCFAGGGYSRALLSSFLVHLALGLAEMAVLPAAAYLLDVPLEIVYDFIIARPLLIAFFGLPQVLALILLAVLVNFFYHSKKKPAENKIQGAK